LQFVIFLADRSAVVRGIESCINAIFHPGGLIPL
jgi:hypothetical protein